MNALTQKDVYTSIIKKDYGTYVKYVLMKSNVRKKGFELLEDDVIEKYQDLVVSHEDIVDFNKISDDVIEQEKVKDDEENKRRSILRSKDKVQAIANMNEWDYFVTLTFDKEKVGNREDKENLKKKTLLYFRKLSKKYGIKYLLIPEYHEDGKCIHWHGLIHDPDKRLTLTDTNKKTKYGYPIYNIVSWSNYKGFNTACEIGKSSDDKIAISRYISKYINKNDDRIFNKYYYCSNGLIDTPITTYPDELPIDFFEDSFECNMCYIKTYNK